MAMTPATMPPMMDPLLLDPPVVSVLPVLDAAAALVDDVARVKELVMTTVALSTSVTTV